MIYQTSGLIDYHEAGEGPTVVLVPGSCSTGAAWRPVMASLAGPVPLRDHQPAWDMAAPPSAAPPMIPISPMSAKYSRR